VEDKNRQPIGGCARESIRSSGEQLTDTVKSALDLCCLLREIESTNDLTVESAWHISERVSAIRGAESQTVTKISLERAVMCAKAALAEHHLLAIQLNL